MTTHTYYDRDILKVESHGPLGHPDNYLLAFVEPIGAVTLSKADIVHLAKLSGLVVFEADNQL
jgi:hypothetical protein